MAMSLVTDIHQHTNKTRHEDSVIQQALEILAERCKPGDALTSPNDTAKYLQLKLAHCKVEVFGAIFLNNRNQVLETRELFQGTINGASVHPRLVVQHGLALNAAAAILYHNHPSGNRHSPDYIGPRLPYRGPL